MGFRSLRRQQQYESIATRVWKRQGVPSGKMSVWICNGLSAAARDLICSTTSFVLLPLLRSTMMHCTARAMGPSTGRRVFSTAATAAVCATEAPRVRASIEAKIALYPEEPQRFLKKHQKA